MREELRKMPVCPVFKEGDVVQISSNLRYGRHYGEFYCGRQEYRMAGKNAVIQSSKQGDTDEYVYYYVYVPTDNDEAQCALISESMLLGTRKKFHTNSITPEFVISCYEQLGIPRVVYGKFFSSNGGCDPLGAIYLAFGGEQKRAEDVKRTLVAFYDKDYIRGFAVGFDGYGEYGSPDTNPFWEGRRDGGKVRAAVGAWRDNIQAQQELERLQQLLQQQLLGC